MCQADTSLPLVSARGGFLLNSSPVLTLTFFQCHSSLSPISSNHEFLSPAPGEDVYCQKWTGPGSVGQFHHRGDGQWHFLCSARKYSTKGDADPNAPERDGSATIVDGTTLRDNTANWTDGDWAEWGVTVNRGQANEFRFSIRWNTATTITIEPFEYLRPDGTPKRTLDLQSPVLNYGAGATVSYRIRKGGTTGYTPGLDANVLVFYETWQNLLRRDNDPTPIGSHTIGTLLHELMHSFRLHHNCGNADLSGTRSCVGSWSLAPVFLPNGRFVRLPRGLELCPEHLIAIRRAPGYGR